MSTKAIKRAEEIISSQTVKNGKFNGEFCSLVLLDHAGYPTASVLTAAASEGITHLWFGTGADSNKYKRAKANKKASVHFGTGEHSITLVGDIEILSDNASKAKFWYDGLEHHFPQGATDPNYVVLKFNTKRYMLFVDWEETEGVI